MTLRRIPGRGGYTSRSMSRPNPQGRLSETCVRLRTVLACSRRTSLRSQRSLHHPRYVKTDDPHTLNARPTDERPVWLVTGAAHGVGRILAEVALRHGNRVVATADRVEDLWPLVDDYAGAVTPLELDVNDELADREVVRRVIEILGQLDVVVNAAGYDKEGCADDTQQALERMQTNLFGALWVSQAALEYMCANTAGRIIQVFDLNSEEKRRDHRLYDTKRRVVTEFSEHLAREGAPFGVEVSICVTQELYRDWAGDNRARTYTLDRYDPEGVEVSVELINQWPANAAETLATAIPALTHVQRIDEQPRTPSNGNLPPSTVDAHP
jgi:NAD(P)-dependent dehydrogenase (short-subunit alcohol dehydrogenase family)